MDFMERKMKRDKRKVLLFIPLLVLPFLALGFYALGGGRGNGLGSDQVGGINTSLPDANFKSADPVDKMGFYAKAGKDTAGIDSVLKTRLSLGTKENDKAAELKAKLVALDQQLNAPVEAASAVKGSGAVARGNGQPASMKNEVDRLELMMRSMQQGKEQDPEMEQMNGLLEKILDIQNPSRIQQREMLGAGSNVLGERFAAISAEIAGNQKVVNGASVRLKLLD
ncbi:MAG: conjugal transfer protein TraM, partial [Pedobacter sp.]